MTGMTLEKSDGRPAAEMSDDNSSLSLKQRLVAWSAAILLLTAAVLKAWPLATGQTIDTQAASIGKLILIQGEILLALWLMSGINAAWAFRAAIVFFAGAAAVNLRSIWLGEVSCGCFGIVEVPPWVSLVTNSVILACLVSSRPRFMGDLFSSAFVSLRSLNWLEKGSVLTFVLCAGIALFQRNDGHDVLEVPTLIDLGTLEINEQKRVAIKVKNVSEQSVVLLGAKTSCTCALIDGLPLKLKPQSSNEVTFLIQAKNKKRVEGSILLYLDDPTTGAVSIPYRGAIKDRGHVE